MRKQRKRRYLTSLVHREFPLSGDRSSPAWAFMLHRRADRRTTMRARKVQLEPGYRELHTWFTPKYGAGWALERLVDELNAARRWVFALRLVIVRRMQ